jgi:hypothetical protein
MINKFVVDRIGEYIQAHQGSGRCVSIAEIAYKLELPGQTVLEVADGRHTYRGVCLQANYDQICPNADLFVERLMRRGIGP